MRHHQWYLRRGHLEGKRGLTLTLGLRWDSFGNPYPENGTILSNFFLGSGSTEAQKITNGSAIQVNHVFNNAITAFSRALALHGIRPIKAIG